MILWRNIIGKTEISLILDSHSFSDMKQKRSFCWVYFFAWHRDQKVEGETKMVSSPTHRQLTDHHRYLGFPTLGLAIPNPCLMAHRLMLN
jgi:hypothetical protein